MSLDIRILCNRVNAQQFIFIVNPSTIVDSGELFHNVFPIAWRVAKFPGTTDDGNSEIILPFSVARTVGVSGTIKSGVVTAVNSKKVEAEKNGFIVKSDEGAYKVELNTANPNPKVTLRVDNKTDDDVGVFLGDADKTPLACKNIARTEGVSFNENTEIAIVAIRGYEKGQVIESEITGPWMKFKARDAIRQGNKLYLKYTDDSTYEIYGGTADIQQFTSDIPVFKKLAESSPLKKEQ